MFLKFRLFTPVVSAGSSYRSFTSSFCHKRPDGQYIIHFPGAAIHFPNDLNLLKSEEIIAKAEEFKDDIQEILIAQPPSFPVPNISSRPAPAKVVDTISSALKKASISPQTDAIPSIWPQIYPPPINILWPNPYITNIRNKPFPVIPEKQIDHSQAENNHHRTTFLWNNIPSIGVSWDALEDRYCEFIQESSRRTEKFDAIHELLYDICQAVATREIKEQRKKMYQAENMLEEIDAKPLELRNQLLCPPTYVSRLSKAMHRALRDRYVSRHFGPGMLSEYLANYVTTRMVGREICERMYTEKNGDVEISNDVEEGVYFNTERDVGQGEKALLNSVHYHMNNVTVHDGWKEKEAEMGPWDFRACRREGAAGRKYKVKFSKEYKLEKRKKRVKEE